MQFAHIDGTRVPATRGRSGICPACSQPLIAKCGTQRVWHWAHKGMRSCDSWYEPETLWHRRWKDEFPPEYQEVVHAPSGERHIADVKTEHGLVLEFQHSHIDPKERWARESFYPNLVWVVDGTRLKRDLPRFLKGRETFLRTPIQGVLATHFPDECFPSAWLQSSALVVFDFEGVPAEGETSNPEAKLCCLLPGRADGRAVLGWLPRRKFVSLARTRPHILPAREIVTVVSEYYRRRREIEAMEARASYARRFRRRRYNNRPRRSF